MNENEDLLRDVLANEGRLRDLTLEAGLAALRRRRQRHHAVRVVALMLIPLLVFAAWILRLNQPRHDLARPAVKTPVVAASNITVEGTAIRLLSDEELLSFFSGRPVALVGSPGHQQLLVFDESRN